MLAGLAAVGAPVKPFDVLLVDDLSRLSRDAAEMLRLARLLEYAGITLISVADGIETGTKRSKLTLSVKAIFNEQYLDDLRERALRGLQGRVARGLYTGGRVYGYRSVPVLDAAGRVDAGASRCARARNWSLCRTRPGSSGRSSSGSLPASACAPSPIGSTPRRSPSRPLPPGAAASARAGPRVRCGSSCERELPGFPERPPGDSRLKRKGLAAAASANPLVAHGCGGPQPP